MIAVTDDLTSRFRPWRSELFDTTFSKLGDYIQARENAKRSWLDRKLGRNIYTKYVPSWNDTPGRTKDEVISALRGAARA